MSKQGKLVLPVTEGRREIEEGKHIGTLIEITPKDIVSGGKTIPYMDLVFTIEDEEDGVNKYVYEEDGEPQLMTLKIGCSQTVSRSSKLGGLLVSLGFQLKAGENFDLDQLLGLKVSYLTSNVEKTYNGESRVFCEILPSTVKKL